MCGRYTLTSPGAVFAELGDLLGGPRATGTAHVDRKPRYNISPTQAAPVLRAGRSGREIADLRWGLVPSYAADPSVGSRHINARAETVAEKPAFRDSLRQRRCLVPADGFYEWRPDPADAKKRWPYFIHRSDGRPFVFAGLWSSWRGELETFTILTTEPTSFLRSLHDRMPLVLRPEERELWLDAEAKLVATWLADLPTREGLEFEAYPVSARVNRPVNDDAEILVPVESPAQIPAPQLDLF
ncbi:MAG: SOS response-associated peptidase [Acidobacteriota bacterium]